MKTILLALIAAGVLAVGSFFPDPDPKEKEELIMYAVTNFLDQVHYRPVDLNDEFSENAFSFYLEMLDNNKRFLLQSDVDELQRYEKLIDDEYKNKSFDFFNLSEAKIKAGIARAENVYNEVIKMDFDFDIDENINLDDEEKAFPNDEKELKEEWRKMIKYEILVRYEDNVEKNEKADEKKTDAELKKKAYDDTKEMFDDWFKRLGKIRRSDRFESYINTITHVFDPHSDYYTPKEKEDFNIRMGGRLEGIGARLQTDGDYTKVVDIIVGGPAWKGRDLEVDDLITAVQQKGEEEVLDITGMRVDDVVQHIRGKKGTTVLLTVKKKDGREVEIEIERDIVITDEGKAKSVIIGKEGTANKYGYIRLPKFYADFESKDGRSCAVDVALEVEKLKAENVDGIILDLRNNGGGSLRDVVQMSGLFIDEGPIVQVKPRGREPYVLEDEDPETKYDGNLIVMVNGYSASASEILAAAMQDYDRAVIVGSKSTFGKGTVQRFYDLDRAVRGNGDLKPLGEVKLTTQKFFRVNGGSTQLKGVTPDIILPDNFHYIETGEKEYDYAMEWTEIDPVDFKKPSSAVDNMDQLIKMSASRVNDNEQFNLVLENAERLKENRDDKVYSLNYDKFNEEIDGREKAAEKFKDLWKDEIAGVKVENLNVDMEFIQADSSRIARNDVWLTDLKKDIYLDEAMNIMTDMVKANQGIGAVEKK
ncbi:carboxy terminal-processing peptidase [Portibacter lacus]|uniref:Tail-specific protease n=1 Tax=Portibacter lacus TaxID=1099794 RepID=A0AA37SPN3_9BACT|nr:carboxy terminal-processing peptidase [Portibacter lacus]GLR17539.1 tail-specific protease [Portibacter lacus]